MKLTEKQRAFFFTYLYREIKDRLDSKNRTFNAKLAEASKAFEGITPSLITSEEAGEIIKENKAHTETILGVFNSVDRLNKSIVEHELALALLEEWRNEKNATFFNLYRKIEKELDGGIYDRPESYTRTLLKRVSRYIAEAEERLFHGEWTTEAYSKI